MKSLNAFVVLFSLLYATSINADIFSLSSSPNILYENGQPLDEYLIYTKDKKCFMHYLSLSPISEELSIQIKKKTDTSACLEKGFAEIEILNEQNIPIQTLSGYFVDGFSVGSVPSAARLIT